MTKKEILEIAEEYKTNVKFEIETSNASSEVKDLCEEIARQSFYAIDQLCQVVAELK